MEARSRYLWGPLTGFGLAAAAVAGALDQASKLWLLFAFRLAERGAVTVAPFVDLVLTWNTGISYGWFQQEARLGNGRCSCLRYWRLRCCGSGSPAPAPG
jgi:signal peptidase II